MGLVAKDYFPACDSTSMPNYIHTGDAKLFEEYLRKCGERYGIEYQLVVWKNAKVVVKHEKLTYCWYGEEL